MTSQSRSYVTTDGQSASLSWCQAPICGLRPTFCYYQLRVCCCEALSRENGFPVNNCCWTSPAQSFLCTSSAELVTIFYSLRFQTAPTWRTRSLYLCTPVTEWSSCTPGTEFPFRLVRLSGLRCRYSNPPPRGLTDSTGRSRSLLTVIPGIEPRWEPWP
jgi:hypothetical protein